MKCKKKKTRYANFKAHNNFCFIYNIYIQTIQLYIYTYIYMSYICISYIDVKLSSCKLKCCCFCV